MATRRTAEGPPFDHAAQYFTVRDERFERYVKSWIQDGIVAPWDARICTLTDGQSEWSNNISLAALTDFVAFYLPLATELKLQLLAEADPTVRAELLLATLARAKSPGRSNRWYPSDFSTNLI